MRSKVLASIKVGFFAVAGLLFIGLGIDANTAMPGTAYVYLDDAQRTYISPPCINDWMGKPGSATMSLGQAADARRLGYQPDHDCREAGGFEGAESSLTRIIFTEIGVLLPPKQWWDDSGLFDPKLEIARSNPE